MYFLNIFVICMNRRMFVWIGLGIGTGYAYDYDCNAMYNEFTLYFILRERMFLLFSIHFNEKVLHV